MLMGGLDKLDVRIPLGTDRTPWFESLHRAELRAARGEPSKAYSRVFDLRPYGIDAVLHERCRYDPHSKLELAGVRCMSAEQIRTEIERLYACQADLLKVMRIDLFADVFDYPVWWFRRNTWVKSKRTVSEFGPHATSSAQVCESAFENRIETLYFGRRPTLFRIYDKGSTLRIKYAKEAKQAPACVELPSFAERFGHSEDRIRTRVEHQLSGSNVPHQLSTLGLLFENAAEYDPFATLMMSPIPEPCLIPTEGDAAAYLQCVGLACLIKERGRAATTMMLNRKSGRNAARYMRRLDEFVQANSTADIPNLLAAYRHGITAQIGAQAVAERINALGWQNHTPILENLACNLY